MSPDAAKREDPDVALGVTPCTVLGRGRVLAEAAAGVPDGLCCTVGLTGTAEAEGPINALAVKPDSALVGATGPGLKNVPETAPTGSFAPAVSVTRGTGPGAKAGEFNTPACTETPGSVLALLLAGNAESAVLSCAASSSVKSSPLSSCSSPDSQK